MFKDKRPGKWVLLAVLFIIVMIGILLFFGISAKAAQKFLPIQNLETTQGYKIWLAEDHSLPIIAIKYRFRDAGAALEPADKQGLARLLSNTMDEGAGDLDSQSFQKALSDNSITLTFDASRDGFGGELKTLSHNKQKAFDLLSKAINSPRFDAEPVQRMIEGNLSRIKSAMSEPDWMAARLLNDKAYQGHPYAQNIGGTLSSLPRITTDDLRAFKNNELSKDRLFIAISGDITADEARKAIDAIFGKLPATSTDKKTVSPISIQNGGKVFSYAQDIPQTFVQMTMPSIDHTDKDFFALQIMNYIYGGAGFGSRLMDEAREKRGLTYGIYSSTLDLRLSDSLSVSTSTKNESAQEMLEIIKTSMTRMAAEPVSAKELNDAKAYITGSMPLSLTSSESIAEVILGMQVNDLPIDYLDTYKDTINAVNAEDIQRVAKNVLDPAKAVTILVGKPTNLTHVEVIKELPNVR